MGKGVGGGEREFRGKRDKWWGERGKRNTCYKNLYCFFFAVADGLKILDRTGLKSNIKTTKMSTKVDVLARALADLNIVTRSEFC